MCGSRRMRETRIRPKAEENLWQDRGGREPDASEAATISWPVAKWRRPVKKQFKFCNWSRTLCFLSDWLIVSMREQVSQSGPGTDYIHCVLPCILLHYSSPRPPLLPQYLEDLSRSRVNSLSSKIFWWEMQKKRSPLSLFGFLHKGQGKAFSWDFRQKLNETL